MENQINKSSEQPAEATTTLPKKSKKLAVSLIVGPIVGLIVVLIVWSILGFVVAISSINGAESMVMWLTVVNIILGILGVIFVLGILIAAPIGVILLLVKS
jgi:hypothetical protein